MQGTLMPIGGAEDKKAARMILSYFVERCGGRNASIVVIPSASQMPQQVSNVYSRIFTELHVNQVSILHIPNRHFANDSANLTALSEVTGIFITGGDQLCLMSLIGATQLATTLRTRFLDGVHIAGTSAGASVLSRHMIAFGRSGSVPMQRMVQMGSGLGLAPDLIIDQHFRQRNRLGRLLTAVALNPGLTGVGIDEDTALVIEPDNEWTVIGSGEVTVVDSRDLEYSDLYSAKGYKPFTMRGVEVQVLPRKQDHIH